MTRPERFQIQLENDVYFPGDIIRGKLQLTTRNEIKCQGIRIHVQGIGHSRFETGTGDDRETRTHSQFYTNCKKTVFGNVHKTPNLYMAGENAIFGPPWAPDEGILYIGVNPAVHHDLILRVMNYDWGKKDDVLGETIININESVSIRDMELPLTRNAKTEKGLLYFTIEWDDSNNQMRDLYGTPLRCLKVTILRAIGLRKADWIGKNDVYVQAYFKDDSKPLVPESSLPEPEVNLVIPAGDYTFPFQYILPSDLPSSITYFSDNYLIYSVYAHIDIAWKVDPSTRHFFTVMQPYPSYQLMYPQSKSSSHELYPQCCIPPCCCCSFSLPCFSSYGNLKISMNLDRGAYAPGEVMRVNYLISSDWEDFASKVKSAQVKIIQTIHLWAEGYNNKYSRDFAITTTPVNKDFVDIIIPSISPTYNGGLGKDPAWFGQAQRYGTRWSTNNPDPITWSYTLRLTVNMNLPGVSVVARGFFIDIPLVVSGIGIAIANPSDITVRKTSDMDRGMSVNYVTPSAPVVWNQDPIVRQALPNLRHCKIVPAEGDEFIFRDPLQDYTVQNNDELKYKPRFYFSS